MELSKQDQSRSFADSNLTCPHPTTAEFRSVKFWRIHFWSNLMIISLFISYFILYKLSFCYSHSVNLWSGVWERYVIFCDDLYDPLFCKLLLKLEFGCAFVFSSARHCNSYLYTIQHTLATYLRKKSLNFFESLHVNFDLPSVRIINVLFKFRRRVTSFWKVKRLHTHSVSFSIPFQQIHR